ncbi:LPS biosynthesis protein WbpP [candidate division LCP-89 bacterium B3_LCP]|uniref:LPS biosynthesis protein WbpP n=1 Tax=candidate division LCP-89 bacterium B3_LCP TaxID=2012998 RepID=A0A532V2T9_UNCL8|nr:MAG: LPS biosynthesis protein WbpP [candidate division LCP-89 bacterium B3_LCP]
MATYMVTGGAGFIGSNLVETLLERNHQVRVIDNFCTGRRENLVPFNNSYTLFEHDIADYEGLEEALNGVDYVLHQAALPSVPRSIADPVSSFRSSVEGTINLLQACRTVGVKRLVFASSSSIYGSNPELPKRESMKLAPLSPYAASKLAAETYCQVYYKVYGLQTVCLRYFNVFGPKQDPNSQYAAVIPKFIRAALRDDTLTIFGDGEQSRDFTYITNVVNANILAAQSESGAGEVFNLACGDRITLNRMVEEVEKFIGHKVKRQYDQPRPGDVPHSQADIERISNTFGFKPQVSFEEGLRITYEYFKEIFSHQEP